MDANQQWELVTKTRGCGADPWHWQLQLPGTKPLLLLQERWGTTAGASRGLGRSQAELHFHRNLFTHRSDEIQTRELSVAVGTRTERFAPLPAAQEAVWDHGCLWEQVQHHKPALCRSWNQWHHSLFSGQLKVQSQPTCFSSWLEWAFQPPSLWYVSLDNYSTLT